MGIIICEKQATLLVRTKEGEAWRYQVLQVVAIKGGFLEIPNIENLVAKSLFFLMLSNQETLSCPFL